MFSEVEFARLIYLVQVKGDWIGIYVFYQFIVVTYTVAKHVETSSPLFIKTLLLVVRRQFKMYAIIYSLSLSFVFKHIFIVHKKYTNVNLNFNTKSANMH